MSTASRSSYHPSRRIGSVQSTRDDELLGRTSSRARASVPVSYDEAYSFALRIAFLRYLLQPRKKRKEYVSAPKPPPRAHTSSISELVKELVPTGSASVKLPSGFRHALEKRMSGVLQGIEKMPGYSDAAVKRTFAEAYTAFTAKDFQKAIDKDRKVEPLVLIFYSSAAKAQGRGKPADDHSWKVLVDRHLAMFVRLLSSILREKGDVDLVARLNTLEKKLMSNDQNLYLDTGQADHSYVEVEIPLSYEVKDMHMVQLVAKIFGVTNSQVQADIDANASAWTEEAALKDYKAYQFRLSAGMAGTLRKRDFDVDDAYEEWRKGEGPHLASIFAEILSVRPDLKGGGSGPGNDKPLPLRPQSMYEDQAYADLSRMLSNPESPVNSLDPSFALGSLSLDDTTSIRSVDEPNYTFIPPDPRAVYKVILQYVVSYDQLHSDTSVSPLSEETTDFLVELAVRWRIPQFSRYVVFVEVATRKFLDQELPPEQLYACLDLVKQPLEEPKKPVLIQMYTSGLRDIDPSRWTVVDFAGYQQSLRDLHDALLRDVYSLLTHCYEPKPPTIGVVMALLNDHVYTEESFFSPRPEDMAEFAQQLDSGLRQQATQAYRDLLDSNIPRSQRDWDFGHAVNLGKAVVKLADTIKKRYRKNPEILGASPFRALVETTLPSFEEDCHEIIKRVLQMAKETGVEIELQDGFDLYKELVEIRKMHVEALPGKPFAFHIEGLLEPFVWRWIKNVDDKMPGFVDEAIKQDQFKVRTRHEGDIPTDDERHSVSIIDIFSLFNQTTEQLLQLEWGDEVHVARFMTALAKSFAAGIGRYCEVVEQQFAREMDRQSAQDAAASSKTTQERWLKYAKDAWNTKEKIEPFQFYPQSFVKFNNIEWAMQALDKLEKRMNVDACAEVLSRLEGPKPAGRKPAHYVFTVKIVEGEELKACDPTGTSDPYVVLCDEYQKRLHKTRVIPGTLNPRWDESVDITVSGPLNLIATIWDHDVIGEHDFVGRTSLKLDPVHFSDYLPREFWLDLDTQGRILIRVSMEGERDDIQFHFGKAFRHLKRTERDMVRKVTSKLSMHINASLSREALRGLLNKGITASVASLWKKRQSHAPTVTPAEVENALQPLFTYFDENFAIMKLTLTDATMMSVMTRLWKEVLLAIENLLVPPMSDKPSTQKPLTQAEMDIVYRWLELLFAFFNAKDETGEVLGVPADVLKSPKWHELASLNFFYFDSTETLIRTSERMAAANAERARQQAQQAQQQLKSATGNNNRLSAGPSSSTLGVPSAVPFGSLGTIRRGKSIMMSRNLGTMRRAKEEKRREAQADPSDDMILRILRMRPEAAGYLRERQRQKERMAAAQAAALIVRQSVNQGWAPAGGYGGTGAQVPPVPPVPAFGGALYARGGVPRR
ncbi:17f16ada-0943-4496-9d3d-759dd810b156 [Thermothielavioides terrestris]|uniref:C2 domain-containing protein n=2 Tax=Thermothielavioides terrestris TaxID=2587410 RepID=G2RFE6_THETT|nr:uncharacterized protein THITE_2121870 [Thermothielavioides terrestris NRRL 8126]AEO70429.1 hypothetical protein THITE_2121870 [Thermothielavioides terrestris NRRL 8126]SPQ18252.1 17f16ada-0943-4496-9d3d-759dd810b156 [Thermothielavioides terrestris]